VHRAVLLPGIRAANARLHSAEGLWDDMAYARRARSSHGRGQRGHLAVEDRLLKRYQDGTQAMADLSCVCLNMSLNSSLHSRYKYMYMLYRSVRRGVIA